jgi:hypothetical protein
MIECPGVHGETSKIKRPTSKDPQASWRVGMFIGGLEFGASLNFDV